MHFSSQLMNIYPGQSNWRKFFILIGSLLLSMATLPAKAENKTETTSHSLVAEGYSKLKNGHLDEALVAFGEAIEHDVNNLDARLGQAMIFAEQERHEDAFAAYDSIIQQNPQHIHAWNGRGLAAFNLEDFDEALFSFQTAVVDQPVNGFFYESIAWVQMCRGEFDKAAESAKKASLMYSRKGKTSLYPLLIAYFSYHESGDAENASRALKYASKNKSANHWPAPVIDYLTGKIDEAGLISFVSDSAEETEAHTYIGLYMRLLGEVKTAYRHLNWVSQNGDQQVFEYTLAKVLNPQANVVSVTR